jgi:gas vesicle protein
MFNNKKHSHLEFFEGMLAGGALSAMSVFLFGTKKGKEFQKEIVHKYHQLCHSTVGMREKMGAFIKSPKVKREMAHFMRSVAKKRKAKKTRSTRRK